MNDRDQKILQFICKRKVVDVEEVLSSFHISMRQLNYSVELINDFLEELSLSQIQKKDGKYYCSLNQEDYVAIIQSVITDVFPKEDRCALIIIMILTRKDALTLDHFSVDLKISKNTALTYINKTKLCLGKQKLSIDFTRKQGYVIEGSEWSKRIVLYKAMIHLYKKYGEKSLRKIFNSQILDYVRDVKEIIYKIESFLSFKYVDEDFYLLSYFMATIFYRNSIGYNISTSQIQNQQEIKSTSIYQALFYLSDEIAVTDDNERTFFALQLLSMNIRDASELNNAEVPLLENALWEFLTEFESHTLLVLSDKTALLKKLVNHFKPAYYRIRYHIPVENALYQKITKEYRVLHEFVQKSIAPLENFFQTAIDDEEVAFITLFIGGHLIENDHNDFEDKVVKAVILCPNGISMSKLIEKDLKDIFPEFLFYPPISIREYKKFMLPHDLVFSTMPVKTEKKVFIINEILDKSEQLTLRQQVLKEVFHLNFSSISSSELIEVVKKYTAAIFDEKKLAREIDEILMGKQDREKLLYLESEQPHLAELLKIEQIKIVNREISWEEALVETSNLLLRNNIVTKEYQKQLITEYLDQPVYIFLKQRLLLPHLNPNLYKQKLGIGMLISKEGFLYQGKRTHIVILLATPNSTNHLHALYEIQELANDPETVKQIVSCKKEKEVLEIFKCLFV